MLSDTIRYLGLGLLIAPLACGDDGASDATDTLGETDTTDTLDETDTTDTLGETDTTGRLYAFLTVERWERATEQRWAGGAIVPFHEGGPAPWYQRIDDDCLVHYETHWDGTGITPADFGAITIDGHEGGPLTWPAEGFEVEYDSFDAGDVITVSSTGGSIGAFTFSGTTPPAPVLTSHDNTGAGPDVIHVPRDEAWSLTWTPVEGEIFVLLLQGDQPAFTIRRGVHCFFRGLDGAAEVPAAALAELLSSEEVDTSNFYFARVVRDRVERPTIDIDFLLWNARQTRVTVDP